MTSKGSVISFTIVLSTARALFVAVYHVFSSFYRNAKARPCASLVSEKGVKQAKVDRSRHLSVCEIAINETKSLPIYLTPATLPFLSPPNAPTPRLSRLPPRYTLISLAATILEVDTSPFVVCPRLLFYLLIYISPLPDRATAEKGESEGGRTSSPSFSHLPFHFEAVQIAPNFSHHLYL